MNAAGWMTRSKSYEAKAERLERRVNVLETALSLLTEALEEAERDAFKRADYVLASAFGNLSHNAHLILEAEVK